ncbi:hypothetical protein WISP_79017 [Willisornis vidua]|uniref:ribonuclease H n=1 Tax=Willisornis vidua TaxID=1566151 RepID=A0ABQ9DB28_9PASS|nr:hypothetical protein WISP_79017 [Willisornis vidua]
MLELQYELESMAENWYATIDIANAFFSIPLAAECRPQFAFAWRSMQYTWNQLPQGWKHSPTICHGLIQTALEKGKAPEHLQYIDDIIVGGDTAEEDLKINHIDEDKEGLPGFLLFDVEKYGHVKKRSKYTPGEREEFIVKEERQPVNSGVIEAVAAKTKTQ